VPVPPEPSHHEEAPIPPEPRISRSGDALILEGLAALPLDLCIKSGRPATNVIKASLRDPRHPMTWFGKRPEIEVGLCRKHYENHSVAAALTWSVFGVGMILLVVSALTMSFFSVVVAMIAIGISGIFRAASPITSPDATEDFATIYGVSEKIPADLPGYEES
jgi:hypothetical protein